MQPNDYWFTHLISSTYCCYATLGKSVWRLHLPAIVSARSQMIGLLHCETLKFIPVDLGPPNSRDLNPVRYQIWSVLGPGCWWASFKLRIWVCESDTFAEWSGLESRLKAPPHSEHQLLGTAAAGGVVVLAVVTLKIADQRSLVLVLAPSRRYRLAASAASAAERTAADWIWQRSDASCLPRDA